MTFIHKMFMFLCLFGVGALVMAAIAETQEATKTITATVPLSKAQECAREGCYILTKEELMEVLADGCPARRPTSFKKKEPLL